MDVVSTVAGQRFHGILHYGVGGQKAWRRNILKISEKPDFLIEKFNR